MLFSGGRLQGEGRAAIFQQTCRQQGTAGSNQTGLVSPGLPASPQPGLMGLSLIDGVFFGEKHGVRKV
jgi:hypothetical protein